VISADETIAHQAVQLRARSRERLPTIDGLIAATALVLQATLVHRDPHLKAISNPHLRQLMLPNK